MQSRDSAPALLTSLRWHRLDVALRNTSNTFARAHPLVILGGLLMQAAPPELKPPNLPRRFLFRPRQPLGDRIRSGGTYAVTLLFPDAELALIERFAATLAGPLHNFALDHITPVRARSLADLAAECPLPDGLDEACLEFITPLSFEPRDAARPWLLGAAQFGALVAARLEKLFGVTTATPADEWADFAVLPYYWRTEVVGASSRFSDGQWKVIGNTGPLYVRGPLARIWPLLLLAAEFPLGDAKIGGGACDLRMHRPAFAAALRNPQTYVLALQDLHERTDLQEEFTHALRPPETIAAEIARDAADGAWQPETARGFRLKKENGGERLVAVLAPRDYILHKALHGMLAPWFDRAFEPAAVGYRPGLAPEAVRARIRAAYREGRIWAVRADIEDFFDQVDWTLLAGKLERVLPRADAPVAGLVAAVVRTPIAIHGAPLARISGLPQGSPLSPLLANLFLDGLDEEMTGRGLVHVRFADDLLVLCRTEDEARAALVLLCELLVPLGLRLNKAKTAVLPVDAGFQFLGQTHGGGLDPAAIAEAGARRTLYVRDSRAWVGVDHDALLVRTGSTLLARVPYRRLDGVVLLGAGGISARAVERLDDWGLPLVFCGSDGRPFNTLAPRTREHFATGAAHAERHRALGEKGGLKVARRLVHAKLHNHAAWLAELPGEPARTVARALATALAALPGATNVEALRGHEGAAAHVMFRFVNDRAGPDWHCDSRVPHERKDAWNSLLDFASHLLFSRLLVFLLQHGLDPWLGCLHSALNRYHSLVYDLMEPFRARLERFVLKLVNRRVIQPADFEPHPKGGTRLTTPATARFVEHWERELLTRYSGDPAHLLDLLEAQVLSLKTWARTGAEPGIYHAGWRRHETRLESEPPPPDSKPEGAAETPAKTDENPAASSRSPENAS